MREIKFRLRTCVNKIVGYEKWYSGSLNSKNFYTANPCWLYSKDGAYWNPKPIKHRHKDQYTGLKDKNGVEIYEGDIVKNWHEDFEDEYSVQEIKWNNQCGYLSKETHGRDYDPLIGCEGICLEVIGNIYENPELLGGD